MTQEIRINYEEVYSKTAECRQRIQSELREMETEYRHAQSALHRMDGSTNAAFMEAMVSNQEKARSAAETLSKLLSFIEASTRQIERDEMLMAQVFTRSKVRANRGRRT